MSERMPSFRNAEGNRPPEYIRKIEAGPESPEKGSLRSEIAPLQGLSPRLIDLFTWTSILLDTNVLRYSIGSNRTMIREAFLTAEVSIDGQDVRATINGVFDPVSKEYQTVSIKDELMGKELRINFLPRLNMESAEGLDSKGRAIRRPQSDNLFGSELYIPDGLIDISERIVDTMLSTKAKITRNPRY